MSGRVVDWQPPEVDVAGGSVFPVRQVWCVGRNYAEHAREMGVDPERAEPIFFSKPAQAVVNRSRVAYPEATDELHHEVELVVFLGGGGRNLDAEACRDLIFGYAVGVDLTRRDVQAKAKQAGHPWEMSKGFDQSAPVATIVPASEWQPAPDRAISLEVNGQPRQHGRLEEMIWPVAELLSHLSRVVMLNAGDVIFTGTPSGVGPLQVGDRVAARIDGLPALEFGIESPRA